MDPKTPPLETLRDGRLKATIWENVNEKNELYHTVSLAKTYEDRDGKLKDSNSFSPGELLRVGELAREAHGVIREVRRDLALERQTERQTERQAEQQQQKKPVREDRPSRFRGRSSGPSLDR